ncbi:MAG: hypothetical protein AB7P03_28145 [Kofleriaceae bacterium]
MGVDYFVNRPCPLQRAQTATGFLQTMMHRRQCKVVTASELYLGEQLVQLRGGRSLELAPVQPDPPMIATSATAAQSSAQLTAIERRLAPWAKHCDGCPTRVHDEPFGCYGYISYPIQPATEHWLVSRALAMGPAALIAVQMLDRLGVTGAQVAQLRTRDSMFSSREPVVAGWKMADGEFWPLTSDLLIELALFPAEARAQVFVPAAVLLGLVAATDATADALRSWVSFPRTLVARLIVPAADASASGGFIPYLRAIVLAARSNAALIVDR